MDKEIRARLRLSNPVHLCAVGFGSGLIKFMPGTFGTLAGLPLVYLFSQLPQTIFIASAMTISMIGIYICGRTADDMKVHDHGAIVWDEIAGIFLTFLLVPFTLFSAVAGFVLFRIFDILKPWPISWLDKNIHGGIGIMLDDIFAGFMACISLHLLLYLIA